MRDKYYTYLGIKNGLLCLKEFLMCEFAETGVESCAKLFSNIILYCFVKVS